MDFAGLTALLASLGGVAAAMTMLVNLGKRVNIVKSGTADQWVKGMNFVALLGLWALGKYFPDVSIAGVDSLAAQVAEIGVTVLAWFPVANRISGATHTYIKGTALLGASSDYNAEKDSAAARSAGTGR